MVAEKSKNKSGLQEFFRSINGLLNQKGGHVLIHADSTDKLDAFFQKVDWKLSSMIPDPSLYSEVYELSFHDENHVVIRVCPLKTPRPFSVLNFHSKTSLNRGTEYLTHCQAVHILAMERKDVKRKSDASPWNAEEEEEDASPKFTAKQRALMSGSKRKPLCESSTVQAKGVLRRKSDAALHKYCWNDLLLYDYITAFAKIPGGGSIYLGLREDKGNSSAGKPSTVTLVPEEIQLTEDERKTFKKEIFERMKSEMTYAGPSRPTEPIIIIFHKVNNAAATACVIEVKVLFYDGLCFASKEGPELYLSRDDSSIARLSTSDWLQNCRPAMAAMKSYYQDQGDGASSTAQPEREIKIFKPPHENMFKTEAPKHESHIEQQQCNKNE